MNLPQENRRDVAILLALTIVGALLRFYRLGETSLWGNEDYLAISVRAIFEHGAPIFPSGVMYPRALPLTYVAAAFASLFGYSEFTLRLPSALCSTLIIPLTYLFARQTVGRDTGLIASALVAVFFWEVMMAHTARMYAVFSLTMLSAVTLIYAAEIGGRRWLRGVALAAIILAAFLHQIALALVVMLLAFIPYFWSRGRKPWILGLYLLVLIIAILGNRFIESYHYQHWNELATQQAFVIDAARGASDQLTQLLKTAAPLFYQLQQSHSSRSVIFLVFMATVFSGLLLGAAVSSSQRLLCVVLAAITLALTFQQIILAGLIWLVYLVAGASLRVHDFRRSALAATVLLACGAILWIGYAKISGDGLTQLSILKAIKLTLSYPPMFSHLLLETYPWLTLAFLATGIWITVRAIQLQRFSGDALVLLVFLLPLLAIGLHPSALERLYPRYIFFLGPYFLIVIAIGIREIFRFIQQNWQVRHKAATCGAAGIIALFLVLSGGASLSRSLALVGSDYGENRAIYDRWTRQYYFLPDYQGPSQYLADNYQNSDVVITMDILAHYAYFPHADYQLSVANKNDAEGWIGAKMINTAQGLNTVLEETKERRVWIVTAALHLRDFDDNSEFRDIVQTISDNAGEPRYRGRDGYSSVYCVGCDIIF